MPKNMRPVVKIEDGEGGAQAGEGLQEAAGEGDAVQRRRVGEAGDAAWDEALRANAEAQAQAIRGMEQARVLEVRVAELAATAKKICCGRKKICCSRLQNLRTNS
jgi:hypothetical protein